MHEFQLNFGTAAIGIRIRKEDASGAAEHLWKSDRHNHAGYELHVMLQGSYKLDVGGREYTVGENEAILIAPGQYHCFVPAYEETKRLSVGFSVSGGGLPEQLQKAVKGCRVYSAVGEVHSACEEVLSELAGERNFSRIMVEIQLARLLVCSFRLLDVDYDAAPQTGVCEAEMYTHQIDAFFERRLKENPYIEELAADLFLTRGQVNRLLKERYGVTFREKLVFARLDRASWLLRHTNLTVGQVAAEVGYTVPSSFYHVFRQHFGITPEQYRNENNHSGEENEHALGKSERRRV